MAQRDAVLEVVVTGRPAVGSTLRAGVTADRPGTASYQWTRTYNASGTPIEIHRATQPTFTPTPAQLGRILSVRVVYREPDGATTTALRTVGRVRLGTLPRPGVRVRGLPRTGSRLRAVVTRPPEPPYGYEVSYRWLAEGDGVWMNGSPARGPVLRLTRALVARYADARLSVRVVSRAPGYAPRTARSEPTARLR